MRLFIKYNINNTGESKQSIGNVFTIFCDKIFIVNNAEEKGLFHFWVGTNLIQKNLVNIKFKLVVSHAI